MTHERPANGPSPLKMPGEGDLIGHLDRLRRQRGDDTFPLDLAGRRCVVTTDPNGIRQILNGKNYPEKAPELYGGVEAVMQGSNILTDSGPGWQKGREVINPSFLPPQIRAMTSSIAASSSNFVQGLNDRYGDGRKFDVLTETTDLMRETLSGTLFGSHVHAVEADDYTVLDSAFGLANKARKEMDEVTQQHFDAVTSKLQKFGNKMMTMAAQAEPDSSLLSRLAHSELDGKVSQLLTVMFAGYETSALTLTWLFDTVERYPDIATRMQDEMNEMYTTLGDRPPAFQDIANLTYTHQVLDEVLRLRPPVPAIARVAGESDTIDSVKVNAGDLVLINIFGVHRNEKYWDNPDSFDPENFASESVQNRDKFSYIPFSLGRRMCIGRGLAMLALPIHAATMMSNATIRVASESATPKFDTTFVPATRVEGMLSSTHR